MRQQPAKFELDLLAFNIHQLTPELAANSADIDSAIFVDAGEQTNSKKARVIARKAATSGTLTAGSAEPRSLLVLTQAVYRRTPQAC